MNNIFSLRSVTAREHIHYPDMDFMANEVYLLQGASGCGKSTLFQLLNGTLCPSSGSIHYHAKPLTEYEPLALRKEVLLLPQAFFLFPESIEENFKLFYQYREEPYISVAQIQFYLQLCKIPKDVKTLCQDLSGGEKQRVFLAICLSFLPRVLLLDEPTSALDEDTAQTLLQDICTFCKEKSISLIFISHDSKVQHFAQNIVYLQEPK